MHLEMGAIRGYSVDDKRKYGQFHAFLAKHGDFGYARPELGPTKPTKPSMRAVHPLR
jgi:hypothetical protein